MKYLILILILVFNHFAFSLYYRGVGDFKTGYSNNVTNLYYYFIYFITDCLIIGAFLLADKYLF